MRPIAVALFALLLVSCSGSKMLQSSLRKYNSSIGYLHDCPKSNCSRTNQVQVILTKSPLDTITTVSKLNGLVLPFLVFNYFETNMKVKLGQSSIQESYDTFFTSSLADESKRSGCFNVTNDVRNDSIYTLELSIDTCYTVSKYRKTTAFYMLVFAYGWSVSESGSPAQTKLQVTAKFRKGNKLIYEKQYVVNHNQPFINSRTANSNNLRSDFSTNMVEGLSLSTKECIEKIVADINLTLYGSVPPIMQGNEEPLSSNINQEGNQASVNNGQTFENNQDTIPPVKTKNDQLNIGDHVTFYNFNLNSTVKGVVKELKGETIVVEYESFGKMKTVEKNRTDIKKSIAF
ncbi:MAG: hypothetical protein PHT07_22585 [Paludibacter sp.]|nr:hypothetical protein [Paludibacter sp.]